MKNRIILASQSPRRLEILGMMEIEPKVMPVDIDETLPEGISPKAAVMFLSLKKALACEEVVLGSDPGSPEPAGIPGGEPCKEPGETAPPIIIASDTVVALEHIPDELMDTLPEGIDPRAPILGKPRDEAEARWMLRAIRDTWHYVATGAALVVPSRSVRRVFCDITRVHCVNYSDSVIDAYIKSGQPFDKAGGYAIQSSFGECIDEYDGDFYTVVGLPYERTIQELARLKREL